MEEIQNVLYASILLPTKFMPAIQSPNNHMKTNHWIHNLVLNQVEWGGDTKPKSISFWKFPCMSYHHCLIDRKNKEVNKNSTSPHQETQMASNAEVGTFSSSNLQTSLLLQCWIFFVFRRFLMILQLGARSCSSIPSSGAHVPGVLGLHSTWKVRFHLFLLFLQRILHQFGQMGPT